jgi:hypothetical protein
MEFISKLMNVLKVKPDPQRYVQNYEEYTEDLRNAPDMTSIIASRYLGYGGCKLVVNDGFNPDRKSYVLVPKTSPFAKFLESYDYVMSRSEQYSFGSVAHVRGCFRVPTTPGQVCLVSEIQEIYVESSHYRSGMAYADGGESVDFGSHSLRNEDPYYTPSKDKQSDDEQEEEEEDVESGKKKGKRKNAKKHEDVIDDSDSVSLAPDLAGFATKSNGVETEISIPQSALMTEKEDLGEGVGKYDDSQIFVTREDYIQYILSTIGKSASSADDGEGITYEKLEECIQEFSRRIIWDTHVEATQDEFNLFHSFVCLSLGDTLFLNTLRRWMDRKQYRTPYPVSSRGKDPVCDKVNPLVDLRTFLDNNFMAQRSKQGEEEEEENGHSHDDDDHDAKCLITGRRVKDIDDSFGMAMFEKYVELIVEEGERLMPVNSAVIAQMLTVCTGVLDMWQEISAQHKPPGQMSTMPDELRIPTSKLKRLAELSEEVNNILSGTPERIV